MTRAAHTPPQKTAVISGGGGGLGMALSTALQADGWRVVLLDLHVAHLSETATQIPMRCDITDAAALATRCEAILARYDSIDLVIYGAGVTSIAPVDALDAVAHRQLFEINYFAAVAMAQAFLPALRASRGTHLAITSVAGFAPLQSRAAYAASKHAMTGFFGSLRTEEHPYGVRIVIAAPAFVATNPDHVGHQESGLSRPGAAKDAIDPMSPAQAAEVIMSGLRRGQTDIFVGRVARFSNLLWRLSPRLYTHLMARSIKTNTRS